MEKKDFSIVLTIRCTYRTKAETFTEAEDEANQYVTNYDFGKLQDIDWDTDAIIDENDEVVKL